LIEQAHRKSQEIEMEVNLGSIQPFGTHVRLEVYAAIVNEEPRVYVIVRDNPFVPIVSAPTEDARALGEALIKTAELGETAIGSLLKSKGAQNANNS
jgi:hypothetical protein